MIKFIISAIFIAVGIFVLATAMVGNFRFGYVLNRMQVGATSDTLGAALIIIGLIIVSGLNATTVKLIIMVLFLWFANPVSSHFLARTEIISNENIMQECEVVRHDSI
ncbi:MAG: monovalent cation/H(+) antiporter subunit G [Oscillospiraceae bacterium]|jgi:multicomponent Na+:H+ antiporter subunit G|nr:monovalent cation/H(+) antiporter subunit G [Oscillospiraceae bacterium]